MKKKTAANLIMVAIIVVIAVAGVLGVGWYQGWFDSQDGSAAVLSDFRGVITMERGGVAFRAEKNTVLREGDKITCGNGATANIRVADSSLTLGEQAELVIADPDTETFSASVNQGEVFADVKNKVTLSLSETDITMESAAAMISSRTGSCSVSVLEGQVGEAKAGTVLEWVGKEQSQRDLQLNSLNDFAIARIRSANKNREQSLFFTNDDLDRLQEERHNQIQEQMNHPDTTVPTESRPAETVPAAAETKPAENADPAETQKPTESGETEQTEPAETKPAETKPAETKPTETKPAETKPAETKPTETKPAETKPVETKPAETKPVETKPAETRPTEPNPTTPKPTEPAPTEPAPTEPAPTEHKNTCSISISCETILDHMDWLDPEKEPYVPEDGWILSATVEFTEGETVFDVLQRACNAYGIQLEFSWTPAYDSYYVEGLNNIYEFDCGPESGWMYKVNGWFPNYGCSEYQVKDGDNIGWRYTCVGLGQDIGGSVG